MIFLYAWGFMMTEIFFVKAFGPGAGTALTGAVFGVGWFAAHRLAG